MSLLTLLKVAIGSLFYFILYVEHVYQSTNLVISITNFQWFLCFSGARKPSVAAIDGLALGGGLEIAMVSCTVICAAYEH